LCLRAWGCLLGHTKGIRMGLGIFSDGCDCSQPPMPNSSSYSTVSRRHVGEYEIAEVQYYGCTTFGGRKLLLLRRHLYSNNKDMIKGLDPHLLGDDHIVMARFEPTEQGWELAELCAQELNEYH